MVGEMCCGIVLYGRAADTDRIQVGLVSPYLPLSSAFYYPCLSTLRKSCI